MAIRVQISLILLLMAPPLARAGYLKGVPCAMTEGYVTADKAIGTEDQGCFGSCWTQASVGMFEQGTKVSQSFLFHVHLFETALRQVETIESGASFRAYRKRPSDRDMQQLRNQGTTPVYLEEGADSLTAITLMEEYGMVPNDALQGGYGIDVSSRGMVVGGLWSMVEGYADEIYGRSASIEEKAIIRRKLELYLLSCLNVIPHHFAETGHTLKNIGAVQYEGRSTNQHALFDQLVTQRVKLVRLLHKQNSRYDHSIDGQLRTPVRTESLSADQMLQAIEDHLKDTQLPVYLSYNHVKEFFRGDSYVSSGRYEAGSEGPHGVQVLGIHPVTKELLLANTWLRREGASKVIRMPASYFEEFVIWVTIPEFKE